MQFKRYMNTKYLVSTTGEVYSEYFNKFLTPVADGRGYLKVTLWIDGEQSSEKIHRLVAIVHLERKACCLEVNHIDGDKLNNDAKNLEWVSHSDNMRHAHATGLMQFGSSSYIAKLDEDSVATIKELFVLGLSNQEIANTFHVARGTISKIRSGSTWKHVNPELEWENPHKVKKLSAEDIPKIREAYLNGNSLAEIGRQFNVHSGSIHSIISGKSWKNY